TSCIMPSNWQDSVVWTNSIAAGFRAYTGGTGTLAYVIPQIEAHCFPPLNKRGPNPGVISGHPTMLTRCARGWTPAHAPPPRAAPCGRFTPARLTTGRAPPVPGRKVSDYEGIVQFTLLF